MKYLLIHVSLLSYLFFSCNQNIAAIMDEKNCFSAENFLKVKGYVIYRTLVSSSGTFYYEYPIDETKVHDGIKRPSKHPENVYKLRFDKESNQIIIENKEFEFNFDSELGLVLKKNQTAKDNAFANDFFCHLLSLYKPRINYHSK